MENRGKSSNKGTLLLIGLCCAALLLACFRNGVEASPAARGYSKALPPDGVGRKSEVRAELAGTPSGTVSLLTDLGRSVTEPDSPLRLVFKWQGSYTGEEGKAFSAANSLSKSLGLQTVVKSEEEGHAAYRSSSNTGEMKTSLFWSEMGEGESYVIVTLETADLSRTAGLAGAAQKAGMMMTSARIAADWNVSLQGTAKEHEDASQALKLTERMLAGKLQGMSAAETYEDETTASTSYTVPSMLHTVQSGTHRLAVQAAIHQDVAKGSSRVTIGFPLITIEY
ncbi:TATA-box binding [Paenibacillus sophorae]|uniref:TATA-box binding n=1 Tax=Paenibacillus sophorae TaxID=1333845 RepID=A0A1H8VI41_9BACL|nr:YwmB family TATA-box binding protein [Paenibacillus sophorae]QWU15437.1 YwmB family TATA-box binding protein [Paenibacillus sophorae]SEP14973.1 TATA-box binding [Paenibacillus sophorae]